MMLVLVLAGWWWLGMVLLVLAWVSARAKFVFLENVVHGRRVPRAVEAARQARRSLFLWKAAMSFAWLVPIACIGVPIGMRS